MNVKELLAQLRSDLDDEVGEYSQKLWKDSDIISYLNDGEDDIAKELYCLTADDNTDETVSSGEITLSGAFGQVDSVVIGGPIVSGNVMSIGYAITSGPVPFNITVEQTAADLAANIVAFSMNPANTGPIRFLASSLGATVRISAISGTGATPNGYAIAVSTSGGMSASNSTLSGGACLCQLFMVPGQNRYAIDPNVIKIIRFKPSRSILPLHSSSKKRLDANHPGWDSLPMADPWTFIPDYEGRKVTVVPTPIYSDVVALDLALTPAAKMSASKPMDSPQIPAEYQKLLIPYAKWKAFQKNDREATSATKAQMFNGEYLRLLGQAKDKVQLGRYGETSGFSHQGFY